MAVSGVVSERYRLLRFAVLARIGVIIFIVFCDQMVPDYDTSTVLTEGKNKRRGCRLRHQSTHTIIPIALL